MAVTTQWTSADVTANGIKIHYYRTSPPNTTKPALVLGSTQPDAYPEEEIRFLTLVADQLALAIDDALNFEVAQHAHAELQRNNERLALLLEVTNSVVANLDLRDLATGPVHPTLRKRRLSTAEREHAGFDGALRLIRKHRLEICRIRRDAMRELLDRDAARNDPVLPCRVQRALVATWITGKRAELLLGDGDRTST